MAAKNKINEVDKYIAAFPQHTQNYLKQMRATILETAPGAEEIISYKMPAYKYHGMLVYFAGFEKHIGFYSMPTGNKAFEKDLAGYKTGKGSIQFPLDKPLPVKLITKIVKFRMKENVEKEKLKAPKKKNK